MVSSIQTEIKLEPARICFLARSAWGAWKGTNVHTSCTACPRKCTVYLREFYPQCARECPVRAKGWACVLDSTTWLVHCSSKITESTGRARPTRHRRTYAASILRWMVGFVTVRCFRARQRATSPRSCANSRKPSTSGLKACDHGTSNI
jgi:hypothetical protein